MKGRETILITGAFGSNCCSDRASDLYISHTAPIFPLMINESSSIQGKRIDPLPRV